MFRYCFIPFSLTLLGTTAALTSTERLFSQLVCLHMQARKTPVRGLAVGHCGKENFYWHCIFKIPHHLSLHIFLFIHLENSS